MSAENEIRYTEWMPLADGLHKQHLTINKISLLVGFKGIINMGRLIEGFYESLKTTPEQFVLEIDDARYQRIAAEDGFPSFEVNLTGKEQIILKWWTLVHDEIICKDTGTRVPGEAIKTKDGWV